MDHRLVQKSGSWFSYDGERIGQGRERAKEFLKKNLDVRDRLERAVRQKLHLPVADEPTAASANGSPAPGASAQAN